MEKVKLRHKEWQEVNPQKRLVKRLDKRLKKRLYKRLDEKADRIGGWLGAAPIKGRRKQVMSIYT